MKLITVFVLCAQLAILSAATYYVQSQTGNGDSATGTQLDPYDSILFAIQNTNSDPDVTLILLKDPTPHYLIWHEIDDPVSNNDIYYFNTPITWSVNLLIRPLFCDEEPALTQIPFQSRCVNRTQQLEIIMKGLAQSFLFNGAKGLTIQNIILNGIDNIEFMNTISNELTQCLKTRVTCCEDGDIFSQLHGSIRCKFDPDHDYPYDIKEPSLFSFDNSAQPSSLTFILSTIRNLVMPNSNGFIDIADSMADISMTDVIIENIYFGFGLISSQLQEDTLRKGYKIQETTTFITNINLLRVQFSKYNAWDILQLNTEFKADKKREGYFLYANAHFYGDLNIQDSSFSEASTAIIRECIDFVDFFPPGSKNVGKPNMNRISQFPDKSFTHLAENYDTDHSGVEEKMFAQSSLIYIRALQGNIDIQGTTFEKIIGTSGAVINIRDIIQSVANLITISITESTFDDNYAYIGFVNIAIGYRGDDDQYLTKLNFHPTITIDQTDFTKAWGCPGAYGNIHIQSYLVHRIGDSGRMPEIKMNPSPDPQTLKFYSLVDIDSVVDVSVMISSCNFRENILSLSNSLSFYGIPYLHMNGNTFEQNGGSSSNIGEYPISKNRYFAVRHPDRLKIGPGDVAEIEKYAHLGTSTVLYTDHVFRFIAENTVMRECFGLYEGSMMLAQAITLKNMLLFKKNYQFDGLTIEGFSNELPEYLGDILMKESLEAYSPSLISVNYRLLDPVLQLWPEMVLLHNMQNEGVIVFKNLNINNNQFSFNPLSYCYQFSESLTAPLSILQTNILHYATAFIKFSSIQESDDLISNGFGPQPEAAFFVHALIDNANFIGNRFVTPTIVNQACNGTEIPENLGLQPTGCLISGSYVNQFIISRTRFEDNVNIYQDLDEKGEVQSLSETIELSDFMTNGLLCGGNLGGRVVDTASQFSVVDSSFLSNKMPLFATVRSSQVVGYFERSTFFGNEDSRALLINLEGSMTILANCQFINNFGAYGINMGHTIAGYTGFSNRFIGNRGLYSSVYRFRDVDMSYESFEFNSIMFANEAENTKLLFDDEFMPSSAHIYLMNSHITYNLCKFIGNIAAGGLFTANGASIAMIQSTITKNIGRVQLLGLFIAQSYLHMTYSQITNNELRDSPVRDPIAGYLALYSSQIDLSHTFFDSNRLEPYSFLIFSTNVRLILEDVYFLNMIKSSETPSLLWLNYGDLSLEDIIFQNVTAPMNMMAIVSTSMRNLTFSNIRNSSDHLFIMKTYNSSCHIKDITYVGNGEYSTYNSLVQISQSVLTIERSSFLEVSVENGKLFDISFSRFILLNSNVMQRQETPNRFVVLRAQDPELIAVIGCQFKFASEIAYLQEVTSEVIFQQVVIFTGEHSKQIYVMQADTVIFDNVIFMKPENQDHDHKHEGEEGGESGEYDDDGFMVPTYCVGLQDIRDKVLITNMHVYDQIGLNGAIYFEQNHGPHEVRIKDSTFYNNIGYRGGAISLIFQATGSIAIDDRVPFMSIQKSAFIQNEAITSTEYNIGKGGALYLSSLVYEEIDTVIENCAFVKNNAALYGGAIYYDYTSPTIENSYFRLNTIQEGLIANTIGSYPTKLQLYDSELNLTELYDYNPEKHGSTIRPESFNEVNFTIKNIRTGTPIEGGFTFMLLDQHNQIYVIDTSSTLTMNSISNVTFSSTRSQATAINGTYIFENFNIYTEAGSTIQVQFNTNGIEILQNLENVTFIKNNFANLSFADCGLGEIKDLAQDGACLACSTNFMKINLEKNSESACIECDPNAVCKGGNNVGPSAGYWRLNETADIFVPCSSEEACIGNRQESIDIDIVGECGESYTGIACSGCIEDYAKYAADGLCHSCSDAAWYYIRVALALLAQIILLAYGIRETLVFSKDYKVAEGAKDPEATSSILVRILINYASGMSLMTDLDISWPDQISSLVAINSRISAVSENYFSIDCFFASGSDVIHTRVVFLKLLVSVLSPIVMITVSILIWLLIYICGRWKICGNSVFKNRIVMTMVIIIFNLQPTIIKNSFYMFKCINIYRQDSPVLHLESDLNVECWEGDHFKWALGLALPSIILWGMILPLSLLFYLRKKKNQLDESYIKEKYCFIYAGYKQHHFYWEFVVLLRKMGFISVSVFISQQYKQLQVFWFIVVIIAAYVLHIWNSPYLNKELNNIEKKGLISVFVMNFAGIYFEYEDKINWMDITFLTIALAANIYFILVWLKMLIATFIQRYQNHKRFKKLMNSKIFKFIDKTIFESRFKNGGFTANVLAKIKGRKGLEANDESQIKDNNESQIAMVKENQTELNNGNDTIGENSSPIKLLKVLREENDEEEKQHDDDEGYCEEVEQEIKEGKTDEEKQAEKVINFGEEEYDNEKDKQG